MQFLFQPPLHFSIAMYSTLFSLLLLLYGRQKGGKFCISAFFLIFLKSEESERNDDEKFVELKMSMCVCERDANKDFLNAPIRTFRVFTLNLFEKKTLKINCDCEIQWIFYEKSGAYRKRGGWTADFFVVVTSGLFE